MAKCKTAFKIVCVLTVAIIVAIGFVACNRTEWYSIQEGVYYSQKNLADESDGMSARLTVIEIDETLYKQANGINVIKDKSSKKTSKYYSVELVLLSGEVECDKVTFDCLTPALDNPQAKRYYEDKSGSMLFVYSNDNSVKYEVFVAQGERVIYDFEFAL